MFRSNTFSYTHATPPLSLSLSLSPNLSASHSLGMASEFPNDFQLAQLTFSHEIPVIKFCRIAI